MNFIEFIRLLFFSAVTFIWLERNCPQAASISYWCFTRRARSWWRVSSTHHRNLPRSFSTSFAYYYVHELCYKELSSRMKDVSYPQKVGNCYFNSTERYSRDQAWCTRGLHDVCFSNILVIIHQTSISLQLCMIRERVSLAWKGRNARLTCSLRSCELAIFGANHW